MALMDKWSNVGNLQPVLALDGCFVIIRLGSRVLSQVMEDVQRLKRHGAL